MMMKAPIPPPIIAPLFLEVLESPMPAMTPLVGKGTLVERSWVVVKVTSDVINRFPDVKVVSEANVMVVVNELSVNDVPEPAMADSLTPSEVI